MGRNHKEAKAAAAAARSAARKPTSEDDLFRSLSGDLERCESEFAGSAFEISVTTGSGTRPVLVKPDDDIQARLREEFSLPEAHPALVIYGGVEICGTFAANKINEGVKVSLLMDEYTVNLSFKHWSTGTMDIAGSEESEFKAAVGALAVLKHSAPMQRIMELLGVDSADDVSLLALCPNREACEREKIAVKKNSKWLCCVDTFTGQELIDALPSGPSEHPEHVCELFYYNNKSAQLIGHTRGGSEVCVQTMMGGISYMLRVGGKDTVQTIKQLVQEREGIPAANQMLIMRPPGMVLDDSSTVEGLRLGREATVHLVIQMDHSW